VRVVRLAVLMVAVPVMTVMSMAAVFFLRAFVMTMTVVAVALVPVLAMAFVTLVLIAVVTVLVVVLVTVPCASRHHALGQKLHAALGAAAGLRAHDLRVHRADVDDVDALGHAHIHLGDERERLVGRRIQVRLGSLALLEHVRVRPQLPEPLSE
jgi:hypothetical protein